jgi:predicted dehydrogenase
VLQVGHIFRFHPVTQLMRERIRSGTAGAVRYCTGRFAGFKRPRTDVGVTQTDGIHYFDLFAYLLEENPTAVTATLRDFLGRGMDDVGFCSVEYGRVPAFIEVGYFAPGTYRDCVIVGEEETLAGDFGTAEVKVLANRHVKHGEVWNAPDGAGETLKVSGPEPLRQELTLFLDACARRTAPQVDVEAGLLALKVVEAAQRSSELGRRVLLSELG